MMQNKILSLTQDGTPHQWISWQDCVTLKVKGLVAWELGGDSSIFGGTSRMTGERSHVEVSPIVAIKGKFKFKREIPVLTNSNLFRRDLFTCGYCGRFHTESHLSRDHIVPVSKGGKDIWSNVITSCKKCNSHKGNKSLKDADLELIWVPYVPCRNEILILNNRNILVDQAKFISDFIPKNSRVPQYLERHCGITLAS